MSNTLTTAEPEQPMTATTPPSSSRKYAMIAVKWVVAIVLLVVMYWMCGDNLAKLKDRTIVWNMFGIALGVRFLSLLATFTRWQLLVRGIGVPLSFREAFRLGMLGEACNGMGPGGVGGDLVKVGLLAKNHPSRTASILATAFLDRILGMWALFMLGAIASLSPWSTKLGSELQWAVWALWGGSAAGLIGITLMFVPAFTHSRLMHWVTTWKFVGKIAKELMDSIQLYQGKPQIVVGAAILGLIGHFGFLSCFYFCAESFHKGQVIPGFIDHVVGLPLPEAIGAAIPTPGGVGGLEAAVAWFYQQYQRTILPESTPDQLSNAFANGILTAVGYRLTMYLWGAVGVVYYMSSRKEIERAVHSVES